MAGEIAKCAECHTPRDEREELRREAWMLDAPIWIAPVGHISNWADQAPPIVGLSSFTEEQVLRVLQKGTGPRGVPLRPPMHIYHMNRKDGKAIVPYLTFLPNQFTSEG